MSKKKIINRKSAGITVEISLLLAMSLFCLILFINLFSANLITLASSLGLDDIFKFSSSSTQAATYDDLDISHAIRK